MRVEDLNTEPSKKVKKARNVAGKAHVGQKRSSGEDYTNHLERVANTVLDVKPDSKNIEHLISAALLHDTLEDTDTTYEELEEKFGDLVANMVKELTSDKDKIKEIGKTEYLADKMINKMSSYSLVIKLADRLDNVQDIATAKTPEWREKYKNQTLEMLSRLEKERELSGTHRKLISMIKDKLSEVNNDNVYEGTTLEDLNRLRELAGLKDPDMNEALTEEQFDEAAGEKDACYHKVKSRYKVWPSAYASGALVKCRKVGAKNWGNKSKKKK